MNSAGVTIGRTGKEFIHLNSPGVVVAEIPINSGLTNQTTHFAYDDGSIHVFVRQSIKRRSGERYFHYWRDVKGKWHHEILPFSGGRPKLVGADDRSLVLLYTDRDEDGREELAIAKGQPNSKMSGWRWRRLKLPDRHWITGEALVDLRRWQQEQVLSIYAQQEPGSIIRTRGNRVVDGLPSPLNVVDYNVTD
jgi:hypothetical protein